MTKGDVTTRKRPARKDDKPIDPLFTWSATLDGLQGASMSRVRRWHGPRGVYSWSVTDWSNAAAGEMGEVCNAVKKLRRLEEKFRGISDRGRQITTRARALDVIADEIADTVIYLDLLALRLKIDMREAVVRKFNKTSKRYGFPERLL